MAPRPDRSVCGISCLCEHESEHRDRRGCPSRGARARINVLVEHDHAATRRARQSEARDRGPRSAGADPCGRPAAATSGPAARSARRPLRRAPREPRDARTRRASGARARGGPSSSRGAARAPGGPRGSAPPRRGLFRGGVAGAGSARAPPPRPERPRQTPLLRRRATHLRRRSPTRRRSSRASGTASGTAERPAAPTPAAAPAPAAPPGGPPVRRRRAPRRTAGGLGPGDTLGLLLLLRIVLDDERLVVVVDDAPPTTTSVPRRDSRIPARRAGPTSTYSTRGRGRRAARPRVRSHPVRRQFTLQSALRHP